MTVDGIAMRAGDSLFPDVVPELHTVVHERPAEVIPPRPTPVALRALPNIIDVEHALLGALLINNSAYSRVSDFLLPEHFGEAVHGRIYAAIGKLIERGEVADPVRLTPLFDQDSALAEIGAARYLARLAGSAVTIVGVPDYARQIHNLHLQRQLIAVAKDLDAAARQQDLDHPPAAILADFRQQLDDIGKATVSPVVRATPFQWKDPATLPRRQWLYGNHLIRGFVSSTLAIGGRGKTSLLVTDALAMVTGRALLGDRPAGQLRVWLISTEDPQDELERRVAATCLHFGISEADLGGRLFLDAGPNAAIVIATEQSDGIKINVPIVDALRAEMRARQVDVLQVDPFVDCHGVNENDNNKIARVMRIWAGTAQDTGCAIDLSHHFRKPSGPDHQLLTWEDGRGASTQVYKTRNTRVLNGMLEKEAEAADVDDRRTYFSVGNGKHNLSPPAEKRTWRRTVGVLLGNRTGPHDPGDEIGVVESWQWPDAFAEVSVEDAKEVQRRIAKSEWRVSSQAKLWAGNVVAEVLGLDPQDKAARATLKLLLAGWGKSGALKVVERKDEKRMKRKIYEVGEWLT